MFFSERLTQVQTASVVLAARDFCAEPCDKENQNRIDDVLCCHISDPFKNVLKGLCQQYNSSKIVALGMRFQLLVNGLLAAGAKIHFVAVRKQVLKYPCPYARSVLRSKNAVGACVFIPLTV